MTHVPCEHSGALAPQAAPHMPQLALLDVRSTHEPKPPNPPAHCVSPLGQPHVPLVHGAPVGQAVPQAPQFLSLVERSVQVEIIMPLGPIAVHRVRLDAQPATHAPAVHVVPGMQRLPHDPQLSLSLCVSVQVEPHCESPAAHAQPPLTQLAPTGHCVPQAPQLSGSLVVSTHALPQATSGDVQLTPQTPALQSGAPASAEHTFPQAPQLSGSLWVRVHVLSHLIPP
jgi:hypothetical protein